MKTKIFLITILVFFLLQCKKLGLIKDEKFEFSRECYNGDELRLDGYYYTRLSTDRIRGVLFFFRNGINLGDSGDSEGNEDFSFEEKYTNPCWPQDYTQQYDWSIFLINGDDLILEGWGVSSGGGLPAFVSTGTILNDTTFVLTESRSSNENNVECIDPITYHFKQFSPKPDSTQTYID